MIFIGADHKGFELKQEIKKWLADSGYEFEDVGAASLDADDDYPDYAKKVSEEVQKSTENKGILVCGTGIGACIAANKFQGIKAALVYDEENAKLSREHNDSNVLCISGKIPKETAIRIIQIWLETSFNNEERHVRRLKKIKGFENAE
ncbi:ribose 5-phosphate isomerase B [Candidatus Woesearchaeota archaeon]|nr:ribose 5-phosphate isomerase B [Candidatus Woesearchaeota archaeon]